MVIRYYIAFSLCGIAACPERVYADDSIKARFLSEFGQASQEYQSYLTGKRVAGSYIENYRSSGQFATRTQCQYWRAGDFQRLDRNTVESSTSQGVGAKVAYVVNDYFPFAARSLADGPYVLIVSGATGSDTVRDHTESGGYYIFNAYAIEGQPIDKFVQQQRISCTAIEDTTWRSQPCKVLKTEWRTSKNTVAWRTEIYYKRNDTSPQWRCLGYRFDGRLAQNKRPFGQEYVNDFDASKNMHLPTRVALYHMDVQAPATPGLLVEEFRLDGVEADEKPRSFFTLTEFGIPEPGESGVRVPIYKQTWLWVAVAGVVVLIGLGVTYLRRRHA